MLEEIRTLNKQHEAMNLDVVFSQPSEQEKIGKDYDKKGHINGEFVQQCVPDLIADFYLCGPTGFLTSLMSDLEMLGVSKERIHFESF